MPGYFSSHFRSTSLKEKKQIEGIQDDYTHVLYAPTWRQYAKIKLFPFEDFSLQKYKKKVR